MTNWRNGLCALLVIGLAVTSCDQPVPPPVAARQPSLDAGDLAVMRALFDDLLRPRRRGGSGAAGAAVPRFLVVDTTMAVCPRDPTPLGPEPGRCMDPAWVRLASEAAPASISRTVLMRFPARNARRLPIAGPLGEDVTYASATLVDSLAPSELLRQYPPGSEVVTLSAPVYPAPRMALIAFAARTDVGAARAERQHDGRWRITASITHPQD